MFLVCICTACGQSHYSQTSLTYHQVFYSGKFLLLRSPISSIDSNMLISANIRRYTNAMLVLYVIHIYYRS